MTKRDEPRSDKKVYERPELKTVGSVEDITHGPQGGLLDGLFGGIGGFVS